MTSPATPDRGAPNRPTPIIVSRLAGSLIVTGPRTAYIVGQPKEPCNWSDFGINPTVDFDHWKKPFMTELSLHRPYTAIGHRFVMTAISGNNSQKNDEKHLAEVLSSRLLIERNGSVSERLWHLVHQMDITDYSTEPLETNIDWLITMPAGIWNIVRDTVLRCV